MTAVYKGEFLRVCMCVCVREKWGGGGVEKWGEGREREKRGQSMAEHRQCSQH